jgi:hypothetical protein
MAAMVDRIRVDLPRRPPGRSSTAALERVGRQLSGSLAFRGAVFGALYPQTMRLIIEQAEAEARAAVEQAMHEVTDGELRPFGVTYSSRDFSGGKQDSAESTTEREK